MNGQSTYEKKKSLFTEKTKVKQNVVSPHNYYSV